MAPIDLETTFRRPRRSTTRALLGSVVLGPILFGLGRGLERHIGAASLALVFAGVAALVTAFVLGAASLKRTSGRVRIGDEGVRLGDELIPRAEIKAAYYVPAAGRTPAHVELRSAAGAQLGQVDVAESSDAERIVDALALGPARSAVGFGGVVPLRSRAGAALILTMVAGLALFTLSLPLHAQWLGILGMGAALAAPLLLVNSKFDVGADGLRITTRLDDRFVPWSAVESIEKSAQGVRLRLAAGKVELPVTSRFRPYYDHEKEAQAALLERCREALEVYRSGVAVDAAARLERRGRTLQEWTRALFDREGDFRSAPIAEERLWEVVESPTASPTARAGAAAVLGKTADEQQRARLRIAGEACAAPRLRLVLDRAASGAAEEEVEQALAEVEDEAEPKARGAVTG